MFVISPLEQFDIYFFKFAQLIDLCLFGGISRCFLDFTLLVFINLHVELIGLLSLRLVLVYIVNCQSLYLVSYFSQLVGFFINFINVLSVQNLPTFVRRNPYLPLFFSVFIFILYCNIVGIFPFHFTVTSHLSVTFGFALWLFLAFNWIGFFCNGLKMFSLFIPAGVPAILSGFLFIIEVISYFARVVSLSVRLFANIIAGHTLLKILSIFAVTRFNTQKGYFLIFRLIPVIIIIAVLTLEIIIARLQRYVFITLSFMYLKDVLYVSAH